MNENVFEIDYGLLVKYHGKDSTVEIPSGVTCITKWAFDCNFVIENLIVPDGVCEIRRDAFGLTPIEHIYLPASIECVYSHAISCAENIHYLGTVDSWCKIRFLDAEANPIRNKKLYIGDKLVTDIEISSDAVCDYAFEGYQYLESVSFTDTVLSIGERAFDGCANLKSVKISDSVDSIGDSAFSGCASLEHLELGRGVSTIGMRAFLTCNALSDLTIPESVTYIGDAAFAYCRSLSSVTLRSEFKTGGKTATQIFRGCAGIKEIDTPDTYLYREYEWWKSQFGSDLGFILGLKRFGGKSSFGASGISPEKSMSIFLDNRDLSLLPTYLEWLSKYDDDDGLGTHFYHFLCTFEQMARDSEDTELLMQIMNCKTQAFGAQRTQMIEDREYAEVFGDDELAAWEWRRVFGFVKTNEYVTITELHESTTDLRIPDSIGGLPVREIADKAFFGRDDIETVILPRGLVRIGEAAFRECENLCCVTLAEGEDVDYGGGSVGASAFFECTNLERVELPKTIISIGKSAFEGCRALEDISMPDTVERIGESAFYNCYSLYDFTLPDGITEIKEFTFGYCTELERINIPSSVTHIEKYAFIYCESLRDVELPDGLFKIGANAFNYCASDSVFTIPSSVRMIGDNAFDFLSTTICGEEGSEAEIFAKENSIKFIPIDKE